MNSKFFLVFVYKQKRSKLSLTFSYLGEKDRQRNLGQEVEVGIDEGDRETVIDRWTVKIGIVI